MTVWRMMEYQYIWLRPGRRGLLGGYVLLTNITWIHMRYLQQTIEMYTTRLFFSVVTSKCSVILLDTVDDPLWFELFYDIYIYIYI